MSSPNKTGIERVTTLPKRAGATTDDFLGGRISVIQPRSGHRSGSDAVWLQAAVPARPRDRVLDVGAGVGVAGLALLARVPKLELTATEIDAGLCALATENAARNGFADNVTIVEADVTLPAKTLQAKGLAREGYDHVMTNPPFYAEGSARAGPAKAAAHIMAAGALPAWIGFLTAATAAKGSLTIIHRPEVLGELLPLLHGRFGALTVFPLFPKESEPATRIILQGRKGSRAGIKLLPGLVLHRDDGRYTAKAEAVLRQGETLDLGG